MDQTTQNTLVESQSWIEPLDDIESELRGFTFKGDQSRILDAGSGNGIIGRYLIDSYGPLDIEGYDVSHERIYTSKNLASRDYPSLKYKQGNLEALSESNDSYDKILCRYVLAHSKKPERIISEFRRILKRDGLARIIDMDGIILNISTTNEFLGMCIQLIKENFRGDLYVGRKIPQYLSTNGFSDIHWETETIVFKGTSLLKEYEKTRDRLVHLRPMIVSILGSERLADQFIYIYMQEMLRPEVVLFYNKFVVEGRKL